METNKETKTINEEELEQVAGGVGDGEQCYFHPHAQGTGYGEKQGADPSYIWMKCSYGGLGCKGCACHGRNHCVDCWHKVETSTNAPLLPKGFANHNLKNFTPDYSTPTLP